jgi:hypothetical protein
MRAIHRAVAIALFVSLASIAAAQTTAPSDWAATERKAKNLLFDNRNKEAIALLEPVVSKFPKFADGHVWLGSAYESLGRDQARSDAVGALKVLDTALLHFRQGFELGGGATPELSIRALVDLLGLLRQEDERRKTIAAAVARHPAMPVAHWYAVGLALRDGTDVSVPLRAARAGIPQADTAARLDYAGFLAGLADGASPAAQSTLVAEVNALCNEAAKARPNDQRVADDIKRINERLAIAATPVDRTKGPAANEAGVRGALRAIASAQAVYSASCAPGFYAPTLAALGRPARGSSAAMLSADLVPSGGATVLERYDYRIEMTAPPSPRSPASCNGVAAGGSAATFSVTARPLPDRSGRSFRIDENGTITTP